MVKPVYMSGIVGAGAAVGLGLGWALWGQSDPVDAIFTSLLEGRCLPYFNGATPDTSDLIAVNIANVAGYVEANRYVAVVFEEKRGSPHCMISDVLSPWSGDERRDALIATRNFALDHVAPLNDGPLVEEDITHLGLGDPQITWRRPDMELGAFASFVHLAQPEEYRQTIVRFGTTKFIRPAQISEGTDA